MNNQQEPLLEIHFRPVMARASGIRVYPDGLYLYQFADDGWEEVWTFSDEEMAELKEAIRLSGFFDLPEKIQPETPISDGTVTVWRISTEGRSHQVQLAPGASVPALESLFHTFSRLRKLTPERSEWQVRTQEGTMHSFSVFGSVNAVSRLRPLVAALLRPGEENNGKTTAAEDTVILVKTQWFTATGIQETVFFSDGRYTRCCDGGEIQETFYQRTRVEAVKDAIASIDWREFPEHIDTTRP